VASGGLVIAKTITGSGQATSAAVAVLATSIDLASTAAGLSTATGELNLPLYLAGMALALPAGLANLFVWDGTAPPSWDMREIRVRTLSKPVRVTATRQLIAITAAPRITLSSLAPLTVRSTTGRITLKKPGAC